MKRLSMTVALLALLGGVALWSWSKMPTVAVAHDRPSCPEGSYLRRAGGVATTFNTSLTTSGAIIVASRVTCTTTACSATLYDTDGTAASGSDLGAVNATIQDEPGAPASTSEWTYYDPPLFFAEGVFAHDDGNVNFVAVYECRP